MARCAATLLLFAGALRGAGARAEAGTSEAGSARPVTRVEVTGNTRTATRVIERALRVAPGDLLEPGPAPQLAQRVMNLRLFQAVDVLVEEDGTSGAVVQVAVAERWTLLPLPMASGSGGKAQAGLMVIDLNFLGQGIAVGAGATVGSGGSGGLLFVQDPHLFGSDWALRLNAGRLQERLERAPRGEVLEAFERAQDAGGVVASWGPPDGLRVGGGWWIEDDHVTPVAGFAAPGPGGLLQGPVIDVQLGATDFHVDHESGGAVALSLDSTVDGASTRARRRGRVAAHGAAELAAGTLSVDVALQAVDGAPSLDAARLGGRPGSRGFGRLDLWADRAATVALEQQVTVVRAGWGSLAAAAFADAGAVGYRSERLAYVSPGLGVRCHLRGIAFPALGVDAAWRIGAERPVVSFYVGLGGAR